MDAASSRLLSHLGGIRYVVGKNSERGKKIASEMNSVRQKRDKAYRIANQELADQTTNLRRLTAEETEARRDEIASISF